MQNRDPKEQVAEPKPPAPEPENNPKKKPENGPETAAAEHPRPREEGVVSNPDFAG